MTTLYIKNMVCDRCILAVGQVLEKLGIHADKISLGVVTVREEPIDPSTLKALDHELEKLGFERMDDRRARMIESIKNIIITEIHHRSGSDRKVNWSTILSEALHYDYNYLSGLFSSVEGITIEHYIIRQKIERVKELMLYDELNLSEIARQLGYSSVAHLSAQFKKVTGMTPSEMKKSRSAGDRKPLDRVN